MAVITVQYRCKYCDELLPVELSNDRESVVCDVYHGCFGETVGYIGDANASLSYHHDVYIELADPTTDHCRECGRDLDAGYLCDDCDTVTVHDDADT